MVKNIVALLLLMGSIFSIARNAYAESQTMTAAVTFIAPLAISSVSQPTFGKLSAEVGETVYVLNTSGLVSVSSGPGVALGGSPAAGSMTISGSSTQTIDISASDLSNTAGGVTPSSVTCKYNGGDEVSCNDDSLNTATAPGSGKTLKVGLTIKTAEGQDDGDEATPSFNITVLYN